MCICETVHRALNQGLVYCCSGPQHEGTGPGAGVPQPGQEHQVLGAFVAATQDAGAATRLVWLGCAELACLGFTRVLPASCQLPG